MRVIGVFVHLGACEALVAPLESFWPQLVGVCPLRAVPTINSELSVGRAVWWGSPTKFGKGLL